VQSADGEADSGFATGVLGGLAAPASEARAGDAGELRRGRETLAEVDFERVALTRIQRLTKGVNQQERPVAIHREALSSFGRTVEHAVGVRALRLECVQEARPGLETTIDEREEFHRGSTD
jgi:hypothetical protein